MFVASKVNECRVSWFKSNNHGSSDSIRSTQHWCSKFRDNFVKHNRLECSSYHFISTHYEHVGSTWFGIWANQDKESSYQVVAYQYGEEKIGKRFRYGDCHSVFMRRVHHHRFHDWVYKNNCPDISSSCEQQNVLVGCRSQSWRHQWSQTKTVRGRPNSSMGYNYIGKRFPQNNEWNKYLYYVLSVSDCFNQSTFSLFIMKLGFLE